MTETNLWIAHLFGDFSLQNPLIPYSKAFENSKVFEDKCPNAPLKGPETPERTTSRDPHNAPLKGLDIWCEETLDHSLSNREFLDNIKLFLQSPKRTTKKKNQGPSKKRPYSPERTTPQGCPWAPKKKRKL